MEPLLTLSEACEYLKITDDTMIKLLKNFQIAGSKIGGRWRFTRECLDDYVKSKQIKVKKLTPQ